MDTMQVLWNNEIELKDLTFAPDQPEWVKIDHSTELAAIVQAGCAASAHYCVFYNKATETMAEHGDEVMQYIEDQLGELPTPPQGESWSGMAVFYLSYAIELWASSHYEYIAELVAEYVEEGAA